MLRRFIFLLCLELHAPQCLQSNSLGGTNVINSKRSGKRYKEKDKMNANPLMISTSLSWQLEQ